MYILTYITYNTDIGIGKGKNRCIIAHTKMDIVLGKSASAKFK